MYLCLGGKIAIVKDTIYGIGLCRLEEKTILLNWYYGVFLEPFILKYLCEKDLNAGELKLLGRTVGIIDRMGVIV